MDTRELFSNAIYVEQEHREEEELSGFISAVRDMFGPDEAGLSRRDWLDESDLIDSPPVSASRNWRAVTIAASARLANRLSTAFNQANSAPSRETKLSPPP